MSHLANDSFNLRVGKNAEDDYTSNSYTCKRPAGTAVSIGNMDWSSMTENYLCFTETFDADAEISNYCDDFDTALLADACRKGVTAPGEFTYQAGRCYPRSGASEIITPEGWQFTGTPQECYDTCVGQSDYMGLELYPLDSTCVCNRPGRQMLTANSIIRGFAIFSS